LLWSGRQQRQCTVLQQPAWLALSWRRTEQPSHDYVRLEFDRHLQLSRVASQPAKTIQPRRTVRLELHFLEVNRHYLQRNPAWLQLKRECRCSRKSLGERI